MLSPVTSTRLHLSARIGYARVSTNDQNLDVQIAALEATGCTVIRTETGTGATLAGRPEFGTILDFIHPGETLVVTRIDLLARSMRDLQVIVATLQDKSAHLAAIEQPVDTSTAAGKAFFDMLGVFAEFETTAAPSSSVRSAHPRPSWSRTNTTACGSHFPRRRTRRYRCWWRRLPAPRASSSTGCINRVTPPTSATRCAASWPKDG